MNLLNKKSLIKDITGAELFKVEAVKEYPYNYRQCRCSHN